MAVVEEMGYFNVCVVFMECVEGGVIQLKFTGIKGK